MQITFTWPKNRNLLSSLCAPKIICTVDISARIEREWGKPPEAFLGVGAASRSVHYDCSSGEKTSLLNCIRLWTVLIGSLKLGNVWAFVQLILDLVGRWISCTKTQTLPNFRLLTISAYELTGMLLFSLSADVLSLALVVSSSAALAYSGWAGSPELDSPMPSADILAITCCAWIASCIWNHRSISANIIKPSNTNCPSGVRYIK